MTSVHATDADAEDVITYEIEPSDLSTAFSINRLGQIFVTKEGTTVIDREAFVNPFITLKVKAKDPERVCYATVRVKIRDINDVK